MKKVINNPPPANLRLSDKPANYLREIIIHGGAAMGRSPQMPPWKDQLTGSELDALVDYLISLRSQKKASQNH